MGTGSSTSGDLIMTIPAALLWTNADQPNDQAVISTQNLPRFPLNLNSGRIESLPLLNESLLLTPSAVGTVTVTATANDDSEVTGTLEVTILEQQIPVAEITVSADGDATEVNQYETLQFSNTVSPENATDQSITWSVTNGTGEASISESGLLTAELQGTVTVVASANDDSGVSGTYELTVIEPVPVSGITLSGTSQIDNYGYTQLTAAISPDNAYDKSFTWSVENGTGIATIREDGMLVAHQDGTVTAKATANDGSGVIGELQIIINENTEDMLVYRVEAELGKLEGLAGVTASGCENASGLGLAKFSDGEFAKASYSNVYVAEAGTYDLVLAYFSAPESEVLLDLLVNETDFANAMELSFENTDFCSNTLVATKTLEIELEAGANEIIIGNTGKANIAEPLIDLIEIRERDVPVTNIDIVAAGDVTTLLEGETLQLSATVTPTDATDKSVTWSVTNDTGAATISESGLLTAVSVGGVTVVATANDGSEVTGALEITITDQPILVESIAVSSENDLSMITIEETLQFSATITPTNSTDPGVTWSVSEGTGAATISAEGLLTPASLGEVTVIATANDGSGVTGEMQLVIAEDILVSGIEVSAEGDVNTLTEGETLQLNATVAPANATDGIVTWSVAAGTGTATISGSGLLTAGTAGTVTVVATANDGSGITGELELTIEPRTVLSSSNLHGQVINIYPNPVVGDLMIDSDDPISSVSLINTAGEEMKIKKNSDGAYDMAHLSSGIYLLKVQSGNGNMLTKRVVKK